MIGEGVLRGALGEQAADFGEGIGRAGEQRSAPEIARPAEDRFGRSGQADDRPRGAECGHVRRPAEDPAAGGDDHAALAVELAGDARLELAEVSLAFAREDFRHGAPCDRLDPCVGVDESPAESGSEPAAHGRLPRGHESDEDHVVRRRGHRFGRGTSPLIFAWWARCREMNGARGSTPAGARSRRLGCDRSSPGRSAGRRCLARRRGFAA